MTPEQIAAVKAQPVNVRPEDYWRMKSVAADAALAEATARAQVADIQRQLDAQIAKRDTAFKALAESYGFDPAGQYTFDDAACRLVPKDTAQT